MSLSNKAGGPYEGVTSFNVLGYWPFVGTLFDVSTNARGAATVQGGTINLAFEQNVGFAQVRPPTFFNVPAVDLRTINFSIEFNLRVASLPSSSQVLLSNWQNGNWQYLMVINTDGTLQFTLRRNMQTDGSNPTQDLVLVKTTAAVPVGKFFNAVYVYNTIQRKLSVFIDGVLAASAVVRAEITDLTLHTATQNVVQFGGVTSGGLSADLAQLRFSQLTF